MNKLVYILDDFSFDFWVNNLFKNSSIKKQTNKKAQYGYL